MRISKVNRTTTETDINLSLNLDGTGASDVDTGCGFLDHMLVLFAKHSRFDLYLKCCGDTNVDYHHTVEDVAICLGKAFSEAIGEKRGIIRYSDKIIPMDEALILCAIDVSGRDYLGFDVDIPSYIVGDFDTELCEEFFRAFVRESRITLHFKKLSGSNSHHIIECVFKCFARTLSEASAIDARFSNDIPSTKGVL